MEENKTAQPLSTAPATTPEEKGEMTSADVLTSDGVQNSKPGAAQKPQGTDMGAIPVGPKPNNDVLTQAVNEEKWEQNKDAEFFGYLNNSGIKRAFVRAIVALYEEPEKPDDPLTYIVQLMGLGIPEMADVLKIQEEVKSLREKFDDLQQVNAKLKDEMEEQARRQQEAFSFDEEEDSSDEDSYETPDRIPSTLFCKSRNKVKFI